MGDIPILAFRTVLQAVLAMRTGCSHLSFS
jgi:hypothetical protein